MKIAIEICAGADHHTPTKRDMQSNITAQQKVLDGEPLSPRDHVLLLDTLTILNAIKKQLPEFRSNSHAK